MLLVEKYDVALDRPATKLGVTPLELAQRYQADEVVKYLGNQYLYEDEDISNVTMDGETSMLSSGDAQGSVANLVSS